ncbi:MAG: HNH endonuclease [Anaerolineaceae bacterium]
MPTKPKTLCTYPGCSNLVVSGRCALHTTSTKVEGEFIRDRETQRLYDRSWQKRRASQLAAQPWCELCLRVGIYTPATDVHHVISHRGDKTIFRSSPLKSLCKKHHSQITVREVKGRGLKKIQDGGCQAQVANDAEKNPNVENPDAR